jgi:hypothetical protein
MLTIEIQYTVDWPQDYIPSGFGKPVSVSARFPDTEDWEKTTIAVGKMNTGVHKVSLQVVHLRQRHDNAPDKAPPGLPCTKKVSNEANNKHGGTQHPLEPLHRGPDDRILAKSAQPQYVRQTRVPTITRHSSTKPKEHASQARLDTVEKYVSTLATHLSADKRAKHQITHMVTLMFYTMDIV